MPDSTYSNNGTHAIEQIPQVEDSSTQPYTEVEWEEELDEELIIEDFTIDGICGVY